MPTETNQNKTKAVSPKRPNKDTFLTQVHFTQFKQLKNVTISFSQEKRLTCIMGVNGIGKTTILQALSCVYNPVELNDGKNEGENYRFVHYLPANRYARWSGSNLQVQFIDSSNKPKKMKFSKNNERWSPRYSTRPYRCVLYFNISSCLPAIERGKYYKFDNVVMSKNLGNNQQKILHEWAAIMNVPYSDILDYGKGGRYRETLGVKTQNGEVFLDYTMGAGEQRVFFIVEAIFKVPEGSLILIDEIELLLHAQALKRFIVFLSKKAKERSLQFVLTSHSVLMTSLNEYMNIEYLSKAGEQTLVLKNIPYDTMFEFDLNPSKPIHILVEDSLSSIIIRELCHQINAQPFVQCKQFGALQNGYTALCGLALNGFDFSKTYIVFDGDVDRTPDEKMGKIKELITGTEPIREKEREALLQHITQYVIPNGYSPEQYIHDSIVNYTGQSADSEVKRGLEMIQSVSDPHEYVSQFVDRVYPDNRDAGYEKVVACFLQTDNGIDFINPIKTILVQQKELCDAKADCGIVPVAP